MNTPRPGSFWGSIRRRLAPPGRDDDAPDVAERPAPDLSPERWQQVQDILSAALEIAEPERTTFLDRACGSDSALRGELDTLIGAHQRSGVLDRPAAELVAAFLPGAAIPGIADGRTVTHYELVERLGGGGMAVVHKARDLRLERIVALKFLPPHYGLDDRAKERFLLEARAAAALDHPNICTIHEIGETDDGQLFLAMPFYEGETLERRIGRGPLALDVAIDLAIQASHGLAEAHERGIVHRDIKPANLVVTPDGVLKILDFGIAKRADVSLTSPGMTPGTVAYMSPEQARGDAVDARTDIWSLGVVLYEMLAGGRPFRGEADAVVLHAIQHTDPVPITHLRPGVPEGLSRALRTALVKDPADRYGTVQDLTSDLERVRTSPRARGPAGPAYSGDDRVEVLPEGERRQATVVVSALSGYAGLVERLVPDRVEQVLRQLRDLASEVVSRHGGMINRSTGDEMVLLFGIPATHEDDSQRAVRAALELHGRVRELSREVEQQSGETLCLHTGIDTGRIIAQPADDGDQEYRIAGAAAQMAGRLAAHAVGDEIWISPECQRLVGPFFETEAREPLSLRDRTQPLVPHRILRESGLRTRWEAIERVELTAHTGRDEELATLRHCLAGAAQGEGQLVTIVGDAGLGKSRLLHELQQTLDAGEISVLHGRCSSYGTSTAYLPFIETLREGLELADAGSDDGRVEKTAARIRAINPELEEFIPLYFYLLSIPTDEYPIAKHLHGDQFRLTMQDALAAILTLRSRKQPTVVLLEDWHWADEASHAVLKQTAEMVSGYPLLLVVTCRPGYGMEWGNPGRHTRIPLQPLEAAVSMEMLKSVLQVTSLPAELAALLHERTGGNPFFLEEISQTLLEEGAVRVERERAILSGSVETLDLPNTVQAVIRARLDRLNREARETLRLASVVGREFPRSILEKTLHRPDHLPHALQTLKSAGLIQQIRVVPEPAYRFKHVLTQEVAYASLLEHQRRDLHGQVGKSIEELHHDRIDEHLDRLAHHFSRAEEWWKAVHYGVQSANRAAALSQFPEALQFLEQAQGWLLKLPETPERQNTLTDMLFHLERACETLGLRGRQQRIIDELIAILEVSDDRAGLAEAYLRQGDVHTLLRRFDDAEQALSSSLFIRRELGDAMGERNTLRSLGLLCWHRGSNQEAVEHMEAALAIDRGREDLEAILGDLSNLGYVLKGMGEYERARSYLEEALEISAEFQSDDSDPPLESGFSLKSSYVLHNLANVFRELGDNDKALEYLQRARDLSQGKRLPIQLSYHYTAVAHIYLQQGKIEESLSNYREAVDLTRRAKFAPGLAQSLRFLGELLLGLDRHEEAVSNLQEAAGLFAQLEDRETEALMWSDVATAHERIGDHPEALAAWSRARTLRKQAGDPAGEMMALEGIGRVTRRHVGEPSLALGHYRQALDLALELRDRAAEGRLRNTMGILEWSRGEYGEALRHYERALAVFRELGKPHDAGLMLNSIGATLKALGRVDEARSRLEEAIASHRRARQPLLEGHALALLGDLLIESGEAGAALDHYERSMRIRQTIGDRGGEGWMLHHLARCCVLLGTPDRARSHAARASEIAAECGDRELVEACERLRRMPGI